MTSTRRLVVLPQPGLFMPLGLFRWGEESIC
ncbi:hypothetical protein A2U01_0091030, partial [Trifolium medium]|nr:hypothetical protein [Trifolium medium]